MNQHWPVSTLHRCKEATEHRDTEHMNRGHSYFYIFDFVRTIHPSRLRILFEHSRVGHMKVFNTATVFAGFKEFYEDSLVPICFTCLKVILRYLLFRLLFLAFFVFFHLCWPQINK